MKPVSLFDGNHLKFYSADNASSAEMYMVGECLLLGAHLRVAGNGAFESLNVGSYFVVTPEGDIKANSIELVVPQSTDNIVEGDQNKFYTNERVDERISENVPTLSSEHVTDDSDIGGSTVKSSFDIIYQGLDIDGMTFKSVTKGNVESGQTMIVDVLDKNENKQAKWLVFVVDQPNETYYSAEILAHHDGATATYTLYASLGRSSVSFVVDIWGNDFRLVCTASADDQSVRVVRTSMKNM
jgi:hypothetical protein